MNLFLTNSTCYVHGLEHTRPQCDFQFCLDLCNRLLEISCALRAREKIIDVLAEFGHLFTLLGKYLLSYNVPERNANLENRGHSNKM